MYKNFTGETPIAALTVSQFVELLGGGELPDAVPQPQADYVHGLRGIRALFGVSHATAQKYKNTFLKPAIMQNGRIIVVDKAKAIELFDKYYQKGGR